MYLKLVIIGFMFLALVKANAEKPQTRTFMVVGVGTAKVVHEDLGEPMAAPERLTISVACQKSGKSVEVRLFRFCKLDSLDYVAESKTIVLKLISARVIPNSGKVECDQVDERDVDLSRVCGGDRVGK